MKRCACGREYDAESWAKLKLVGYSSNGRESAGEILELRNCPCGSTLTFDFGEEPDTNLGMTCVKESS